MASSKFTKHFLMLFSAPIIWAVHFLLIYVFTAIICARPALYVQWLGIGVIEWGVAASSVAAIAVIGYIHAGKWRTGSEDSNVAFVRWTGGGLALLSVLAIIYETLPILLVPACG